MPEPLMVNLIGVACIAILGGLFAPRDRLFFSAWVGWVAVTLSLLGWAVYVVAHFAAKWWW